MSRIRRALISVSDATGLEELAQALHTLGIEIVALQPMRDFEGMPEPMRARNFDRAQRKFDLMEELGTGLLSICSSVAEDASGDTFAEGITNHNQMLTVEYLVKDNAGSPTRAQAAAAFTIVVDARRESLGAGHPLTARAMVDLARAQAVQNRSVEARSLATAAAEVLMAVYGESHPFVSDAKKLAAP